MALPRPPPGADLLGAQVEVRPPARIDERLRQALRRLGDMDGLLAGAISARNGLVIR